VDHLDANVVRKLKQMAKALQEFSLKVTAAHVYVDPSRSDYYLESNRPKDFLAFKQLYGPRELTLKLSDFSLRYPVTGFSQINESQIPNLLNHAKRLLSLKKGDRLLDLYCGYGLFAFGIGKEASEVIGAEWEGPSVESAKASAKFLKRFHYKFISGKIDESFVERVLPKPIENEIILLDPPRKGCLPGVIETLAKRNPKRVLHIFCGTDEIPLALKEWQLAGYSPKEILPLDLFPGTAHIETMILLDKG
jgi:tRNA/tmRNA/rRNA uracil-C5-methylase (TrmA/RlmC/RlmD family)